MKKLFSGALIALCAAATHAATPSLNAADQALLSKVTQVQYQALIYTTAECGFAPSMNLAVTLLKSPGFTPIVDALAKPVGPLPLLDEKACTALVEG
ncbi:MAG TPA: hypothetical protein VFL64_10375 [Rhizobacter sp.]|nr:hypothetical protein [Rhizobacter sp.]